LFSASVSVEAGDSVSDVVVGSVNIGVECFLVRKVATANGWDSGC
jgi:hypothetical protein